MSAPPVGDPWIRSGHVFSSEGDTSDGGGSPAGGPGAARGAWGTLEILEEIGCGGFGRVYRAWEPTLAREVALKIIRPPADQPEAVAAILREGQLLARVRHPNVVTIHGAQQIAGDIGLWMEFVRGYTLAHIVRSDGPRAAGEAALIGVTLCQALAAVHQTGVVHRDVKGHNVMREAGGRIVLMDFGAGQALAEPGRPDGTAIGTPVYMAPEVLAGSRASARSDIYSLGVLLYYLVTGTYPVEGRTWTDFLLAHARSDRRHLGDVRPDLPPRFVHVVERATTANPDDRYATPGAMLRELADVATGEPPTAIRPAVETETRELPNLHDRPASRKRTIAWAIAGGATALWLLGGLTSFVFNHTLGRAGFVNESPLDWWMWGFKSLVSGAVQAAAIVLLWMFLTSMWRLLTRLSPPVDRLSSRARASLARTAHRIGLDDPETAAHALLAIQVAALVAVCWQFRDLFGAFATFIDAASAADIEPLRPVHFERHQNYNLSLAMLIFASSVGAWQVAKLRRATGTTNHRGWLGAILGVIALTFVVLVFPYRLMWHNEREVVTYGAQPCYLLGERAGDVLLYCPASAVPKTRVVPKADPRLQRSQQIESIYTR